MKRKLSFLFLSALTIPFFMVSCSDDKEEQEVKPATDLVVDNNSVTLLQGDEITVSITSGNGDYYVKPFDENVATATINGNKVTIKATENSQLEENNRTETTILIVDGRKKVARVLVRVAKLWDLTVDAPEEGFDLFIGEKRLVKILTGNGDYQISIPEGADKFLEVGELSGQVIPLTAKFETGADPVNITITDKKGVGGTTVFENWGNGGSGLDAQVCLQNISENKPAWGAELPATYNGDKSRFEPIECPHSY